MGAIEQKNQALFDHLCFN